MGETELIRLAQSGDEKAYVELMQLYHRTIEKFAYQCGVHQNDVSDVTQEVFIKLYRFLYQFQHDRFTTWLYKITLNAVRDYYRKESKEKSKEHKWKEQMNDEPLLVSTEKKILLFEEDQQLHDAILSLDEKYRYPIIFFYFQELSYEQIGEVMNIPLSTVKTRILRAKEQLKIALVNERGEQIGR
ncbi:RNA polymerase sigma factor [Paenisporosarcina cavernae]|uniref:Sigma-70 family RNA polymerase sigma factor n=1 Tax=Paenisporosarcina cavernae TaxID=2320858 RepID=A0A385YTD2_9BACL|nr:sigma-70 family RNA polymerase sigma factor [Paenisporosarcina cavernae]AYC29936.1 sigma-70 family RNA polymerase sigma factor [Paenisporosarcina cavernae]